MAVLAAQGVSAGYRDRPVLHEVDVAFDTGLHLVLGANGAGKTTLFRTLAGVLAPSAGRVLIDGRDPRSDLSAKALIGVSAHRAALAPRLSVIDNLTYWAHVLAVPAAERRGAVESAIGLLDLGSIAGQRASTLSRGQAQRVSLARCLVANPPILLLDEPLSGVDPAVGVQLRDHLRALVADGHTLVVSTHELAEASEIGDDVTVVRAGRIVGRGTTAALRATLMGEAFRLRLRGSGDLAGVLTGLDYPYETTQNGAVIVEVPDEATVEKLVASLVAAGIGVRQVTAADNPLEDLYLHLQATAVSGDERAKDRSFDGG